MATDRLLAFDLGASSGRALIGTFHDQRIELQEVHRFVNRPVQCLGRLHWDTGFLWEELKTGLRNAVRDYGKVRALGVDTWGVDIGLIGRGGGLVGVPFHYRDERNPAAMEAVFNKLGKEPLFQRTGLQFLPFNTLFQLYAMVEDQAPQLQATDKILWIADLLHYWFTGRIAAEYTLASTGQMLDPRTRDWAYDVLDSLGIPRHILPEIVQPGTILGSLTQDLQKELAGYDLADTLVVTPATHDTGAAVAAVPGRGDDWVYLSSGTWSLMGVELAEPRIDAAALQNNFTNEGGVEGTIRFLKNIAGLWLVQECRRYWAEAGHEFSFGQLVSMAREAPAFRCLVNPDHPSFLAPGQMPAKIADLCRQSSQPTPENEGQTIRCALESLALRYRQVLEQLEQTLGRTYSTIHIVGGGTQNKLLCQFTADATGREVVAGPVEATALGNLIVQAGALGIITGGRAEAREWIRHSFPVENYTPNRSTTADWNSAFQRFLDLA
ncbi:MAG: rhamnulokinase [Verrucomicrobiota bacterium]|nr:rhamnulokinase [Verrucomicrobiota bacterium]